LHLTSAERWFSVQRLDLDKKIPKMAQPFRQSSHPSSAYTRHLQQVSAYLHYYGGSKPQPSNFRTERQLLEENHKFIRDDDDDDDKNGTGEKEIARRYYEKLFREFALVELGRWREGMVWLVCSGWEVHFYNDRLTLEGMTRWLCAGAQRMKY
jgi:hypothetical protein